MTTPANQEITNMKVPMKRFAVLLLTTTLWAVPISKQERATKWLVDFDDVVDTARDLHITGLESSLTALRVCALANISEQCAAILKPFVDVADKEGLAVRRLSGVKPKQKGGL